MPEDIPEVLKRLTNALADLTLDLEESPDTEEEWPGETAEKSVSLRTRAFPLIELLKSAMRNDQLIKYLPGFFHNSFRIMIMNRKLPLEPPVFLNALNLIALVVRGSPENQ